MKFKIGDKIRIKKDTKVGSYYDDGCFFAGGMEEYKNEILTISDVNEETERYYIEEDEEMYNWSESMVESALLNTDKKSTKKETKPIVTQDYELGVFFIEIEGTTICARDFAMAKLHPGDDFNREIGQALAYKRFIEGGN